MGEIGETGNEQECKLRRGAQRFVRSICDVRLKPHNSESILLRLTGNRFVDLRSVLQINVAKSEVETALLRERKKARMKHRDYDLNRHIALHQASKSLDDLANQKQISDNFA